MFFGHPEFGLLLLHVHPAFQSLTAYGVIPRWAVLRQLSPFATFSFSYSIYLPNQKVVFSFFGYTCACFESQKFRKLGKEETKENRKPQNENYNDVRTRGRVLLSGHIEKAEKLRLPNNKVFWFPGAGRKFSPNGGRRKFWAPFGGRRNFPRRGRIFEVVANRGN